jgi:hypothetical protein
MILEYQIRPLRYRKPFAFAIEIPAEKSFPTAPPADILRFVCGVPQTVCDFKIQGGFL